MFRGTISCPLSCVTGIRSSLSSSSPYRIETLADHHFEALARLFQIVFAKKHDPELLRRKYDSSHLGIAPITSLAFEGETAVAFYGLIPTSLQRGEERYLGAQSCDYLTHPDHRRKGLHKTLSDLAFERAKAAGISTLFAFMNNDSLASGKRLGWTLTGQMKAYTIPTGALPLAKGLRKLGLGQNSIRRRTESVFNQYQIERSELRNQLNDEGFLCVEHSPAYFGYKQYSHNFAVRIGSSQFWLKGDRNLLVGSIHFEAEAQLHRDLETLRTLSAKAGFSEMILQAGEGTRLYDALEPNYQSVPSWTMGFYDLGAGLSGDALRLHFGDFDTF